MQDRDTRAEMYIFIEWFVWPERVIHPSTIFHAIELGERVRHRAYHVYNVVKINFPRRSERVNATAAVERRLETWSAHDIACRLANPCNGHHAKTSSCVVRLFTAGYDRSIDHKH